MNSHVIDYKIYGDDMQFVEVKLDPSETVMAEAGAMMMSENIVMETIFGDGSAQIGGGFMDKLFGAGKRILYAILEGPGAVWIQSLTFSRLAESVRG